MTIEPAYQAPAVRIYCGHALDVLPQLPAESAHCCVTSPPYWGLRSYGHWEQQCVWGTLADFHPPRKHRERWPFRLKWRAAERGGFFSLNGKTWIGAYGLEPTPELYVQHTVEIFREVRRVLRGDGTLWLNLGDSYTSGNRVGHGTRIGNKQETNAGCMTTGEYRPKVPPGLKPKDLVGIPWMVAFALRADGWYLRSDIIWNKPNPMPESVQDRPTKSHEYLFLLSKNAKYFYDADAIREDYTSADEHAKRKQIVQSTGNSMESTTGMDGGHNMLGNPSSGRNKRSVWTIPTAPFPGAHFATFPPKLIEPCILAGTSNVGCCPECGAPWRPVVEKERKPTRPGTNSKINRASDDEESPYHDHSGMVVSNRDPQRHRTVSKTVGWEPGCKCGEYLGPSYAEPGIPADMGSWEPHKPVPCTVLDPFMGSGTTAVVAKENGRHAIGIELNAEYIELARERMPAGTLF